MTIIADLVKFIRETPLEKIPSSVCEDIVWSMIDCIGVTFSGARTKDAEILENYLKGRPTSPEAIVIGRGWKADILGATLINGTMAHAEDYDDCGRGGHISAVIVPVALALAQIYHKSGREFLRALVLAYEAESKIAQYAANELMLAGWHSTSVLGVIGATVASGILADLNDDQFANALGLATTRASGLMVHFGTGAKPYHVGMAASAGVDCILLAKAGVTASFSAIEGLNGYTQAFAHKKPMAGEIIFGEPWVISQCGIYIKRYPTCSASHTAQDALQAIMLHNSISWEQISKIIVGVPEYTGHCLIHPKPQNAIQARFSMPYAMAVTAVKGQVNLAAFKDDILWDTNVRGLMQKVSMVCAKEFSYTPFIENEPAIVTVKTSNGDIYTQHIDYAIGCSLHNPISREDLLNKFINCSQEYNDGDKATKLFCMLEQITKVKDMNVITDML